ncbi:MAG: hypothetical protein AMDU3_IPLC00004G0026 [Thermoplasmatales archaeon I-plasma]|jgi:hypothetical protein|nr:MAG: hypothetical protein AMDU3_IPLC00004G0026 [Thermoplasmatales archaeon I-plasma]
MRCATCGRPAHLYNDKYNHLLTVAEADRYLKDPGFIDGHELKLDFTEEYKKIGSVIIEFMQDHGLGKVSIKDVNYLFTVAEKCEKLGLFDYMFSYRRKERVNQWGQMELAVKSDNRFYLKRIREPSIKRPTMMRWTTYVFWKLEFHYESVCRVCGEKLIAKDWPEAGRISIKHKTDRKEAYHVISWRAVSDRKVVKSNDPE